MYPTVVRSSSREQMHAKDSLLAVRFNERLPLA
jgi:hypothetical protein